MVTLEIEEGRTRIWVEAQAPDGTIRRQLLRETPAAVTLRETGADPAQRASFVTWDEGADQRWFSFSYQADGRWSQARPLEQELLLRDGEVSPAMGMPSVPGDFIQPEDGRLFIVQFRTVGLAQWRQAIVELGGEVFNYFPHNAHLVRMSHNQAETVRGLDFVERVEPYHPWYRIPADLREWVTGESTELGDQLRLRVVLLEWGAKGKERLLEDAARMGVVIPENAPAGQIVELVANRAQLGQIVRRDDVLWIDRWSEPHPDMDLVREDSGANFVEDSFGYCGQGVRGEVLDVGIEEIDHMDFDGIRRHTKMDINSHGTSTYGIVFGNGDRDGDGDAKATGLLPCAEQGYIADTSYMGDRFTHTEELTRYPYYASFQSNSWSSENTNSYNSLTFELDDLIWRLDFAILTSQGNTGSSICSPQSWAKNVISVGGIRHMDTLDTSDDSWNGDGFNASIGPAEDGRVKPDLHYWYDSIYTTAPGGYTPSFNGTSAATPAAAGVLGLMVEMWSDNVWNSDPHGETVFQREPHASTIKALMVNNAQQYDFSGSSHDLTRTHQGWGRPSARLAKERAATSFVVDEELPLQLGETSLFSVEVPGGESELKVTMVYTDPPGTVSAAMHRINDLNLKVTSPGGTVYHGNNGLLVGTESASGGSANDLDTVENVFIKNPPAGTWTVEIHAAEINQDAYPATAQEDAVYALVVTGGTSQLVQPSAGSLRLNQDVYGCGDLIDIRVNDGNVGSPTVSVEIRSSSESTSEIVLLTETRANSGKYAGTIMTTPDPAVPGDGLLSVAHGDSVIAEYVDATDGAGGVDLLRQARAVTDCKAAVISGVEETELGDSFATIVWTTDEVAETVVLFDQTTPPATRRTGRPGVTFHEVPLTGLTACTRYFYEVQSSDVVGLPSVDDNFGDWYSFTTLGDFGDEGLHACSRGLVELDAASYACSSTMNIDLADTDLNTSPGSIETVQVLVTSTLEPGGEWVTLTEVDADDGRFKGSIDLTPAAAAEDGLLSVEDGSLMTVTYQDADDGEGSPTVSIDTAHADCRSPGIRNVRIAEVSNTRFRVEWDTDEPASSVVEYGLDANLGSTVSDEALVLGHSLPIHAVSACEALYFRVSSADQFGESQVADAAGEPFVAYTRTIGGLLFYDGFETDLGWQLEEEWEIDAPQGLGGDPDAAFSGAKVAGEDLTGLGNKPGLYETSEILYSPTIDASAASNLELSFRRYLGVSSFHTASVKVRTPAVTTVWESADSLEDSTWQWPHYDISSWADGQPSLRISFETDVPNSLFNRFGWNIDEVIIRDATFPEFEACDDCSGTPTFRGLAGATDAQACAAGGVTLNWEEAPAWGTGANGAYDIYRSKNPGFTPSAGNRVAAGVTGTSWVDPEAPLDVESWYVVRARSDESCPTEGKADDNLVRVAATETIAQPAAGSTGASLRVEAVGGAHIRLSWSATTGTDHYSIRRGLERDASDSTQIATTTDPLYEDEGSLLNSANFFYLVDSVNSCGEATQ